MPEPIKLILRLPPDIHARIKLAAEKDRRSINSEIIHALDLFTAELAEAEDSAAKQDESTNNDD
ncbi:hypothetical protein BH11ARM1_BH11ARM1_12750 [soil metagenome]